MSVCRPRALNALVVLLALDSSAWSATLVWDNEALQIPSGDPDTSMLSEENWDPDSIPAAGDDLQLLAHGDPDPVFLPGTLTVNSIVSRVPMTLQSTLIVSAPSEFENSLAIGSNGRLRSNGPVTFKGNNFVGGIALEGPFGFTNEGTAFLGSKGVSTLFNNLNEAVLSTPNVRLAIFNNTGTLCLFDDGGTGSSSIISNAGIVIKKADQAVPSVISAQFVQNLGLLQVEPNETLVLDGPVQEFRGGLIQADGTLNLTQVHGGTVSRLFDGISFIGGSGTINQLRSFQLVGNLTVSMSNDPGYQLSNDLMLGRGTAEPGQFLNQGFVTINGSPDVEFPDPALREDSKFVNLGAGTVLAADNSNPSFTATVKNDGTWSAQSMRVADFENRGTLTLGGTTEHINPVPSVLGARLANLSSGTVRVDPTGGVTAFTVTVFYDQSGDARTEIAAGTLNLDAGSAEFSGSFAPGDGGILNIRNGLFARKTGPLTFSGSGICKVGGSLLNPIVEAEANAGVMTTEFTAGPSNVGGFQFRSGIIEIGSTWKNKGILDWQGGTISEGTLENEAAGTLRISPGGASRSLEATINNTRFGIIEQTSSLSIEAGSGEVYNSGIHVLAPGASMSGTSSLVYHNPGLLRAANNVSSVLGVGLENTGLIDVGDNSVLSLPHLANLDGAGKLSGGIYAISQSGQIVLPRPLTSMKNVLWLGPGGSSVQEICGPDTTLAKTTSETHSSPLVAEDGATLELGDGTTTTVPEVKLRASAKIKGLGELLGDLDLEYGTVAPGKSPGTLTVTGNVTWSGLATYEWEAASASSSDLLVISTPTTLAGIVQPRLLDGYVPTAGQSFTILTAPSVTGTFDFVDQSFLPPGLTASLGYTASSVTLSFGAASLATYEAWRQTRFSPAELLDPGISGPDADPDGDGITNKAEFAHGLNPKAASGEPVRIVAATESSMDLRFPWAAGTNASYTVLGSGTGTGFLPAANALQSTTTDIVPGVDELTVRATHDASPRQFSRLEIVVPLGP